METVKTPVRETCEASCIPQADLPAGRNGRSLSAPKLAIDSNPDELGSVLSIGQNSLNTSKGPLGEPCLHVFGPSFYASHAIISHMRY